MTHQKPDREAGYFEDLRCLARAVRDATNLVNFRWYLYDEARRKAWLGQHPIEPPERQLAPRAAGFKDRRRNLRREADHNTRKIAYDGEELRRGKDRRAPDRAA